MLVKISWKWKGLTNEGDDAGNDNECWLKESVSYESSPQGSGVGAIDSGDGGARD